MPLTCRSGWLVHGWSTPAVVKGFALVSLETSLQIADRATSLARDGRPRARLRIGVSVRVFRRIGGALHGCRHRSPGLGGQVGWLLSSTEIASVSLISSMTT
ncbi:hypothetical protein D3C81_1222890 [compost metagenome]